MGRRPDQASDFAYKAQRLSSGTKVGSRIQQLCSQRKAHSSKLTPNQDADGLTPPRASDEAIVLTESLHSGCCSALLALVCLLLTSHGIIRLTDWNSLFDKYSASMTMVTSQDLSLPRSNSSFARS